MQHTNYLKENLSNKTENVYLIATDQFNDFQKNPSSWVDVTDYKNADGSSLNPYGSESKKVFRKKDANERIYEIWVDAQNDVKTFVLIGNKNDKSFGILGTDNRAVVKEFGRKGYDYVKVDDFIDRQLLVFKSALKIAGNDEPLKKKIIQYQEKVLSTIRKKCQFDDANHNIRNIDEQSSEKFNESLAIAKDIIENSLVDLAHLTLCEYIDEPLPEDILRNYIKQIKSLEIDIIREEGRPFIIKTNVINDTKFVSVQLPLGKNTIPSSDRTGKRAIKLSNHVRDGSGVINTGGKIQMRVVVDGHSSYPPINETDERTRRLVTYQAFEEKIKQLALDKIEAGDDSNVIKISIATIMMLTPLFKKNIEQKARGKESEHNQLSDTQYGINMFLAQKQPVEIEIERNGIKEKVKVAVDSTLMNLPVNAGHKTQLFTNTILQENVNNRGMHGFMEKTLDFLNNSTVPLINQATLLLQNNDPSVTKINQRITELKADVNKEYLALKDNLIKGVADPKNPVLLKKYDELRSNIFYLEEKINKQYNKIKTIEKKNYRNHSDQYDAIIKNIRARLKDQKNPITQDDQNHLQVLLYYLEAQKIFREESYLRKRNAYQFHINFALALEMMGVDVEAFCKSAEDRTGWLRVSLLANVAFKEIRGYPPDLANDIDRKLYYELFAAKALEMSASIENNKYNSEARSLQVDQAFTNPFYNMKSGNLLSKLAKDIFPQLTITMTNWFGTPNSMMQKLRNGQGPSNMLNELDLFPKEEGLRIVAKASERTNVTNHMKVTAHTRATVSRGTSSKLDAHADNLTPSTEKWERKRFLRSTQSISWEVTNKPEESKSTLIVTKTKNISDGLFSPSIKLLGNNSEKAQVDMVAKMVETLVTPLKAAGLTNILVTAESVPNELKNIEPIIAAYCKLKGYRYQPSHLANLHENKISENNLKFVESKYDQFMKKDSKSELARSFESLTKPRILAHPKVDKPNVDDEGDSHSLKR